MRELKIERKYALRLGWVCAVIVAIVGGAGCQKEARQPEPQELTADTARAKTPRVSARFSTDSILLGDRFTLRVEVEKDLMQMIDFPLFENGYLGDSIEINSEGRMDTLAGLGRRETLVREYQLTCFEPGIYNLGSFPVLYIDKNIVDTLWSIDSLHLVVTTFEIDTTTQTIYGIKPQLEAPLRWAEISGYLWWGCMILSLTALLVFLWVKRPRNQPLFRAAPAPEEPPHVIAMRQLEQIDAQHLWQNGQQKRYYTDITDVLRRYLEARYGFPALEYTSAEILAQLANEKVEQPLHQKVQELLWVADFVKFAKLTPDAQQNERSFDHVRAFVQQTQPLNQHILHQEPVETKFYGEHHDASAKPRAEEEQLTRKMPREDSAYLPKGTAEGGGESLELHSPARNEATNPTSTLPQQQAKESPSKVVCRPKITAADHGANTQQAPSGAGSRSRPQQQSSTGVHNTQPSHPPKSAVGGGNQSTPQKAATRQKASSRSSKASATPAPGAKQSRSAAGTPKKVTKRTSKSNA